MYYKKDPTSVDEWKERFKKDRKRRPGWSVLPIEILFSEAYLSLSPSAQLSLQFALTMVQWGKGSRSGKRQNLINDTVYLPTNALKALGIRGSATHTKIRNELVEKGFLDTKKSGTFLNPGCYRISYRWRRYPDGEYHPSENQPPPGLKMGHSFKAGESSEKSFSPSEIERKRSSEIERKESGKVVSLRSKSEGKRLPSKSERSVLCAMRQHGTEREGVRTEEENLLPHRWFIQTFGQACQDSQIDPPSTNLSESQITDLNEWIEKKLNKEKWVCTTRQHHETISTFKDKLREIVTNWNRIDIRVLGDRVELPPQPDLSYFVSHRKAVWDWVNGFRTEQTLGVLGQLERQRLREGA
jgi:hypothetical protein